MALANSMTLLLDKIERRLGLIPLSQFLPENMQKPKWADVIQQDTLVEFSRYFPNQFKMIINDESCNKKLDNSPRGHLERQAEFHASTQDEA